MNKAIFLDRDGVINVEKNYLYKIEEFEFIDGVFDTLSALQEKDFKLFIITNQSGIARGYYSQEDFDKLTVWMCEEFEKNGIHILQVECCPHGPDDDCLCRKPRTLMIENILNNHEVDLEFSWLIGDKNSDILCAKNAGIKNTIQVQSGHKFNCKDSNADFVMPSIKEVKEIIN